MDQKKLLLLMGAGIVALMTGLAAKSLLAGSAVPVVQAVVAPAPKGPRVLVAQRALPVGTIITQDAIGYQEWPRDLMQDAYYVDGTDMSKLLGTVVRFPITAGQPLTKGALVSPGDRSFLAAALSPGMRAITIPVSDKSAVAGFVFPGDHVDLMLSQTVTGTNQPGGDIRPLNVAETILKNLRVLAVDQSLDTSTESTKAGPGPGAPATRQPHTVTLEVTPRIAEKIAVAQSLGTLNLTLRSISDDQNQLDRDVASGAAKLPGSDGGTDRNGTGKNGTGKLAGKADNQSSDGFDSFSTGGDVSRFQRSSTPSMMSRAEAAQKRAHVITNVQVVRGNTEDPDTGPGAGGGGAGGAGGVTSNGGAGGGTAGAGNATNALNSMAGNAGSAAGAIPVHPGI